MAEGLLDDPDSYDRYEADACPECGADVGIQGPFWWCDDGHFGLLKAVTDGGEREPGIEPLEDRLVVDYDPPDGYRRSVACEAIAVGDPLTKTAERYEVSDIGKYADPKLLSEKGIEWFIEDHPELDLPPGIANIMREEEIDNMLALDGWAVGTVVHVEDGEEERRLENAWIELFNGEGRAGEFGGVRFMAIDPDDDSEPESDHLPTGYAEAYAYGDEETWENNPKESGWYVAEYVAPEDPNVGETAP